MNAPGEKLVIRLWETLVDKGIGGLLRPWQIRREARAAIHNKTDELLAVAQAERYADDIRAGKLTLAPGNVLVPSHNALPAGATPRQIEALEYAKQVAVTTLATDALRREVNVAKAVLQAEVELQQETSESPEKRIDDDWLYRWRDYAGQVSGEQMQELWGRVLAGELKSPQSFSLRALAVLSNLSQHDAKSMERLFPFVLSRGVCEIGEPDPFLNEHGMTFSYLLEMQGIGIVAGVEVLGLHTEWKTAEGPSYRRAFDTAGGGGLVVRHADGNKIIKLDRACVLTAVGQEIAQLVRVDSNEDYLRRVGEAIKKQDFEVELVKQFLKVSETHWEPEAVEKL